MTRKPCSSNNDNDNDNDNDIDNDNDDDNDDDDDDDDDNDDDYYYYCYCWRALSRQHRILYNSVKKAKSVGCKIEDMRSRLCFLYPGILGCL